MNDQSVGGAGVPGRRGVAAHRNRQGSAHEEWATRLPVLISMPRTSHADSGWPRFREQGYGDFGERPQLTCHADFRITTVYVRAPLADPEAHGLHAVDRGENVWVLLPRDEGVFDGGAPAGDVPCVSPAQVYLDLAAHPERSKEAAEKLRADLLNWRTS